MTESGTTVNVRTLEGIFAKINLYLVAKGNKQGTLRLCCFVSLLEILSQQTQ